MQKLELLINEVYSDNCVFKTMALKEPLVGRHYITEMLKSMMRRSHDLHFNIDGHAQGTCNGSRMITFNHYTRG